MHIDLRVRRAVAFIALFGAAVWLGWRFAMPGSSAAIPATLPLESLPNSSHKDPAVPERLSDSSPVELAQEQRAEIERIRRELISMEPILPGEIENEIAMELLRQWARIDPIGAIQFAEANRALHGRDDFGVELFVEWLDRAPDRASAWALAGGKTGLGQSFTPTVISLLAQERPDKALVLAMAMQTDERAKALASLFSEWAENDPMTAARAANGLKPGRERDTALYQIAVQWADSDPASAMAWISNQFVRDRASDIDYPDTPMGAVLEKWASQSPEAAARYAVAQSNAEDRSQMFAMVASQWAGQDASAAMTWAESLPDPKSGSEFAAKVLAFVGETSPSTAAALALEAGDARRREMLLETVLQRWSALNASDVSIWATQQLSVAHPSWNTSLIRAWVAADSTAAGNWLRTLPKGLARDTGFSTLAQHLGASDPEAAQSWILGIGDPLLRQRTSAAVANH